MASYTSNYNLKKPAGTENININDINGNMDTIDTALKNHDNKLAIATAYPTKTAGSKWTSGTISLRKRAGIVMIKLDGAVFSQITARETIATVPSGYEPATESYFFSSDLQRSFLVKTDGAIQANSQPAGTCWGTECYIAAT